MRVVVDNGVLVPMSIVHLAGLWGSLIELDPRHLSGFTLEVACPFDVSRRVLIGAVVFVVLDVNERNEPAGIVNKVHLLGNVLAESFDSHCG
jgi:hypothetical protein